MNRKKLLTVLISSLSVLFLIGVCLITTQVNDNNSAKELIQAGVIQNNESATPPTNEPNAVQNAEQAVNNNQAQNVNKNSQSKIDVNNEKDDTFYTGPEEGDTVEAHNAALNFSTPNDVNYTEVWYGINNGTLTIGPTKTDDTPDKNEQAVNETPKWFNDIYSIFTVKIVTDEDEFGNVIYVTPECTKSWFSTACEPGDFHKPRISKIEGIENINMSGVTDASYMFCGIGLKWACKIDTINSWSIEFRTLSNLTNAEGMFSNCQNNDLMNALCNTQLDEQKGPQIHPEKTTYMFIKSSLASLNMENWSFSNCIDASYMFNACPKLTEITKIPTLNINDEKNLRSMFNNTAITKLDLTSWPTTCNTKTNMTNLFRGNANLAKIYVQEGTDWSNCKDEYAGDGKGSMFYNSPKLTGCNGTNVTVKSVYKPEYARVDLGIIDVDGNTVPGYFSATTVRGVYNSNDKTLTIVHDNEDHSGQGITVYQAVDGAKEAVEVPWSLEKGNVASINYADSYLVMENKPDTAFWFDGFSVLECTTIPSEITSIGESCYEGCTNLRKFVAGNDASSNAMSSLNDVGKNAFKGCSVLETFVIRKTDSTNITTYGTDAFKNAGSSDPTVAAPLIFASCEGDNLPYSGAKFYKYNEVNNYADLNAMGANTYNFLTKDITDEFTTFARVDTDCVLDLNKHTINRGLNEPTVDGNVFIISNTGHLRLDDTSTMDATQVGKIMGGYTSALSGSYNPDSKTGQGRNHVGGGFFVNGTLDMANGRIYNCKAREGGAVGISNDLGVQGVFKMYHGLLDGNSAWFKEAGTDKANCGGGAIMVRGQTRVYLYDGELYNNNSASPWGGAIYENTNLLTNCVLYNIDIHDNYINYITEDNKEPGSVYVYSDRESNDSSFYATPDATFELETTGLKGCPLYEFDFSNKTAKIVGHKALGKYVTRVPAKISDGADLNFFDTTGINSNSFSGDALLKKIVIENTASTFVVEDNAFNGAQGLENYVVRATSSDNITYQGTPFAGAGSNDPTIAAPLIAASKDGGTTFTKSGLSSSQLYKYSELKGNVSARKTDWVDDTYYYLTEGITHTKGGTVDGAMLDFSGTYNCVLDLNHQTLNRNAGDTAHKGAQDIMVRKNSTIRIDDSSGLSVDHVGKIIGGNNNGTESLSGYSDGIGGGIFIYGTLNFVNGRVTDNSAPEAGGIAVGNSTNGNAGPSILRMYGGYIDNNVANTTNTNYGGGGIEGRSASNIFIYGGEIFKNKAVTVGGGIQVNNGNTNNLSRFLIMGGKIYDNLCKYNTKTEKGDPGGLHFMNYHSATDLKAGPNVNFEGDNPDVEMEAYVDGLGEEHKVPFPVITVDNNNHTAKITGVVHNNPDSYCYISGSYKSSGTAPDYTCTEIGNGAPINSSAPCIILDEFITKINDNAFDSTLRKLVVHESLSSTLSKISSTTKLTVSSGALSNASHLENFVVRSTSDSFMDYEGGCFSACGDRTGTKPEYAPFIIAGGNTTKAAKPSDVKWYQFATISENTSQTAAVALNSNYYYSLTGNIKSASTSKVNNIKVGTTTEVDCVLDLYGYNIDRNVSTAVDDEEYGSIRVWPHSKLRVDNTANICLIPEASGQIKGGKTKSEINTAGGIHNKGKLDFVNAVVRDNVGGECGGISSANSNQASTGSGTTLKLGVATTNIYGGVVAYNSAGQGGGVGCKPGGIMNMYGGQIIRNNATNGGAVFLHANYYDSGNVKNQTQFNFYGGFIGSKDGLDGNENIASDAGSVYITYGKEIPTSTIDIKGIFNMYYTNGICGMIKYNYKGSAGSYSKAGIALNTKEGHTIGTYSDYHIDPDVPSDRYEIETKK